MRTWFPCLCLAIPCAIPAQDPTTLWNEGRRIEAIEVAAAALARSPADGVLRLRLVRWEIDVHRSAAALEHMEPLGASCDPLRGEALYALGDYAGAVEHLSGTDVTQLLMKIDALEALSRFEESDAALEKARGLAGKDDARVLACDGRRLARQKRWPEAVAAFRQAVDRDPLDGEALFGLGRALVQGGWKEEGLKVLARHRDLTPLLDQQDFARRGVDLAPSHAPNWTALGDAERALGRLERAEQAYRTAASIAGPGELAPNALRHARLLSEERGDVAAAIELLSKAVDLEPDPRLWVRIGDLDLEAGRSQDAVRAYGKALELRPKDAEVMNRLEQVRPR